LQALSQRRIEIERIVPDAVAATCGSHGAMTSGAIFDDRWMRALAVTTDGALLSATLPRSEGNLDHLLARARARLEASGATVEPLALALDLRKVDSERVASVEEHVGETTIYRGRRAVELLAAAAIGSSIDLRTGALVSNRRRERSHRLAAHCLGAAATILVVATIGFSLRGKAFERHLSGVHARQLETYQTIDSGASTLPMGASLRLASERVRLEGLTRGAQDDTASSDGSSALELLREIAASLPTDAPIMLTSARLEAGQFVLRGQTSEHRQAERIAEAIGKVADLEVKPPRTTRLAEGGVEFSLTAEVR
jgi:hypothetical protein